MTRFQLDFWHQQNEILCATSVVMQIKVKIKAIEQLRVLAMDSLNNIDFKKLASQQRSIQMKMRLLALEHFKDGHSRTQISNYLKVSRTSVNKWVRFFEEGLKVLHEKPRMGRPPFLDSAQREQLS